MREKEHLTTPASHVKSRKKFLSGRLISLRTWDLHKSSQIMLMPSYDDFSHGWSSLKGQRTQLKVRELLSFSKNATEVLIQLTQNQCSLHPPFSYEL